MKTAISIPDDVFDEAEALARRMKKSRSEIYSRAVREYVARHSAGRVTEALDDLLNAEGETADDFAKAAARHTLRHSEW
jgi:predicted transcriptional regulator